MLYLPSIVVVNKISSKRISGVDTYGSMLLLILFKDLVAIALNKTRKFLMELANELYCPTARCCSGGPGSLPENRTSGTVLLPDRQELNFCRGPASQLVGRWFLPVTGGGQLHILLWFLRHARSPFDTRGATDTINTARTGVGRAQICFGHCRFQSISYRSALKRHCRRQAFLGCCRV